MNVYEGQVLRVIDGDTFDALVNLGFGVYQKFRVRVEGVDTPEMNTREGKKAKMVVEDLIGGKTVYLSEAGSDKYGRALARVELITGKDLTEYLIEHKLGKEYKGGRKLCSLCILEG